MAASWQLPIKRKQTPLPSLPVIEISSDEERSSYALPPPKRRKSDGPSENGLSATTPDASRDAPVKRRQLNQSDPASAPASSRASSRAAVNGASADNPPASQRTKGSPWNRLSRFSYPGLLGDELALDTKHDTPTQASNRHPQKSGSPLLDRITKVREAARSETPLASDVQFGNKNLGSHLQRVDSSSPSKSPDPLSKSVPTGPLCRISKHNASGRQNHEDNIQRPPSSSSQKLVSVDIPLRSGPGAPESPARRPQLSQSNIEVRIPVGGPKAEKNAVLRDLEQSTRLAREKPELVQRVVGQTGFSALYSTEEDLERMRRLGSKKKKSPRQEIRLNCEDNPVNSLQRLRPGKIVHPADSARDVLTSRFDEKVFPPLTFANDVNQRRIHGKFQFTDRYIIREGIKLAPASTNVGCSCEVCDPSTCLCFTKEVPEDKDNGIPKHKKQIRTYVRRPDGIVVLSDEYLERELNPAIHHFEVTECNELCGCGPSCWNRVVAKGRTVPLEIFQTLRCGFGVRSSQDIFKGQFIELYLGEVLTEAELCRREACEEEDEPSYIYQLDWFDTIGENYHIDGKYFGSAMRFVNHSCNPNARCFPVQLHKGDKKFYYLAFFAIQDIKAGVEIRIGYEGRQSDNVDGDGKGVGEGDEELVRCKCGEKNCRKFLWPSNVKTRRRRRQMAA